MNFKSKIFVMLRHFACTYFVIIIFIIYFISEPITEILGGPDLFINMGSTINLTCLVKYSPEPPPNMTWSHNSRPINFDSPRGGISLVTEKGQLTTSRLLIQKAVQTDSGSYTCAPSNANSANVRVHILNGKRNQFFYIYFTLTLLIILF